MAIAKQHIAAIGVIAERLIRDDHIGRYGFGVHSLAEIDIRKMPAGRDVFRGRLRGRTGGGSIVRRGADEDFRRDLLREQQRRKIAGILAVVFAGIQKNRLVDQPEIGGAVYAKGRRIRKIWGTRFKTSM
jgi:hypothetical protein